MYEGIKEYQIPKNLEYIGCIKHIKQLPVTDIPEIFGFHPNAAITKDLKEQNKLCNEVLLLEGGSK